MVVKVRAAGPGVRIEVRATARRVLCPMGMSALRFAAWSDTDVGVWR